MLTLWVVVVCGLLVSLICTALVLHRDYEDGLIGRIGLAFIALACSARVMQIAVTALERWLQDIDKPININPANALLLLGLAMFMTRHFYRFLRWRSAGAHDWRGASDAETCGKR
jgi:hypothetical protein